MTVIIAADAETPSETEALPPAAVEAQAEAAVEIAAIEADASVERAEIHAETEVAAIEAAAEVAGAVTREELAECQRNIGTMQETLATISSQVQLISDELIREAEEPPPNPSESPESELDVHPEARIPEAESPPEPVKKKPRINWT